MCIQLVFVGAWCVCAHTYVYMCMHMGMYKRDGVERRTWMLEAPGAQSQRQNTNREIHSRHTPLAPISLSAPQTSLHLTVLLYALALIYSYFKLSLSFLDLIHAHSKY